MEASHLLKGISGSASFFNDQQYHQKKPRRMFVKISHKNRPEPSTTTKQANFDGVTRHRLPPPAGRVLATEEGSEADEASWRSF